MKFVLFLIIVIQGSLFGLTFFVSSDPHYGYEAWSNNEAVNKEAIEDMNELPGTPYPDGALVETPKGVIVPGDLTGSGNVVNFTGYWLGGWIDGFASDYGVNKNEKLKFPVYEGYGNHDIHNTLDDGELILTLIKIRNQRRADPINLSQNGLHYSWDWDGVHFVQLNLYPGNSDDARGSLDFLKEDLKERVGDSRKPVVLVHHYDILTERRWWTADEREAYYQAIKDYNVVLIITGHAHHLYKARLHGIPAISAPAVKDDGYYLVIRMEEGKPRIFVRSPQGWAGEIGL